MLRFFWVGLAAALLVGEATPGSAQTPPPVADKPGLNAALWGAELERAARPGAYVPYDGAGWMQRYHFEYGPGLFLGISAQRVHTLVAQDRVQRLIEIGPKYQAPWNPYGKVPLFNRLLGRSSVVVIPVATEPPGETCLPPPAVQEQPAEQP